MGLQTGSSLGRAIRELPHGDLIAKILGALIFLGLVMYIVVSERRRKQSIQKEISAGSIQSMTSLNAEGTLHLVSPGGTPPTNIQGRLRSFNSVDEIYHYVYKKYDEALYSRLLIHLPNTTNPIEFTHNKDENDEANLARLRAAFSSPAVSDAQNAPILT